MFAKLTYWDGEEVWVNSDCVQFIRHANEAEKKNWSGTLSAITTNDEVAYLREDPLTIALRFNGHA